MRLRNLLPALALIASPAFAQNAHFGLQGGISMPQSDAKDLVDSKTGITLGLAVPIDLKGGHVLRPRLDYTKTKGSQSGTIYGYSGSADVEITTTMIGMDYNYYVSGKATDGFYLIAGLGYANTKLAATLNVSGFGSASGDSSAGGMALAFGVGYQFTPLVGGDIRYTTTEPSIEGEKIKNDAVNIVITFTF